jgi:hypothetical protein
MSKLILIAITSILAAIAYGNTKSNNPITGIEQKQSATLKATINVPFTLYNQGKGSVTDDIDSSKVDFSKQFLILVRGEVPGTGARLHVKSLVLKDHILTLSYKLEVAGKPVSPLSPNVFFFAVIVDKKYETGIKLTEL